MQMRCSLSPDPSGLHPVRVSVTALADVATPAGVPPTVAVTRPRAELTAFDARSGRSLRAGVRSQSAACLVGDGRGRRCRDGSEPDEGDDKSCEKRAEFHVAECRFAPRVDAGNGGDLTNSGYASRSNQCRMGVLLSVNRECALHHALRHLAFEPVE
jgi:hypothetical protein